MKEKCIRHSVVLTAAVSLAAGLFLAVLRDGRLGILPGILLGIFCIYPLILTALNLFFVFCRRDCSLLIRKSRHFEYITLVLGSVYSLLLLPFSGILFADWQETLHNAQIHTPIWTEGALTVAVLALIGVAGYLYLSFVSVQKVPPLLPVCAIAAMYIGMIQCILWIIQIFQMKIVNLYLCLFPFNLVLIGISVIRKKVCEWNLNELKEPKKFDNFYLEQINRKLSDSSRWPGAAFLLMWPLLGFLICLLLLFGQRPDNIVRAWTETSDWNLSTKISPQNVYYDQHYLCTVAAGGHPRLVKPIRKGIRHGHEVIVNRQLCIANAFEQVLEEYVPVFHKCIRKIYDTYGFPIAKWIHSPYTADIVYILMKPLEIMFLMILYAVDTKPENRIAVQYLPKRQLQLKKR